MCIKGVHILGLLGVIVLALVVSGCTSTSGSSLPAATITATPTATATATPTIKPTLAATPIATVQATPTIQPTQGPGEIRPDGDYKIYNPDDYDYINWQYAIAAYTKAWYDKDWVEVSKNALPSWRNRVKLAPEDVVKTMFEFKQLKGVEVTGANTIDDRTTIVTANAWYYDTIYEKDVTQTLKATLKRETVFGEPGGTSGLSINRFYIDPFIEWGDPEDLSHNNLYK